MSADTLRRAAKVLCEHAQSLPGHMVGPWFTRSGHVIADDGTDVGMLVVEPYNPNDDAPLMDFIALMNPPVALALAAVMDRFAWMGEMDADLLGRVGVDEVIALARAILREGATDATP